MMQQASSTLQVEPATGKAIYQLKGFEQDWGYANSVRAGDMVYVSGTVSIDAHGKPEAVDDMAGQVRRAYADVAAALAAHGLTMSHIVREALVTTNLPRFIAEGASVRLEACAGHSLPASAPWMQVARLAQPEFLFEVEVMAYAGNGKREVGA